MLQFKTKLKINRVSESDHGPYYCVARNSLSNTRAKITLKGKSLTEQKKPKPSEPRFSRGER